MSQHRPGPPPGNRPAPPRNLAVERRWGQGCLAYFVCIRPDTQAIAGFAAIQDAWPRWSDPCCGCRRKRCTSAWHNLSTGELVHATLFRYGASLEDPARLLERLDDLTADVEVPVSEMCVATELVFPCLDYEIIHRFPLAPAPDRRCHQPREG